MAKGPFGGKIKEVENQEKMDGKCGVGHKRVS